MPTLVLDPAPPQLQQLLERRRHLGLDSRDELWQGVYRMIPPPSLEHQRVLQQLSLILTPLAEIAGLVPVIQEFALGDNAEYVVPDGGLHRPGASGVWQVTAALAIEVISPGDATWEKVPFYAAHHVDELLIVDPDARAVHWLSLTDGQYGPVERSGLIALGPADLAEQIAWP